MARITVVVAMITGITAAACATTMDDLSTGEPGGAIAADPGPTKRTSSSDADGAVLAPTADTKLPSDDDAGVALAGGCRIARLVPTTATSLADGAPWREPTAVTASDGVSAESSLSTDARDSATLVVGGFTVVGEAIPPNAKVKGIEADVARSSGGTCIIARDVSLSLNDALRPAQTANDAWNGVRFYGGLDDTWGAPVAAADLASAKLRLSTHMQGSSQDCKPRDARVDAVVLRVQLCVE